MKIITFICFLFTFYVAFASQDKGLYMQYRIDSTQFDKSLKSNESTFSFKFYSLTETHVNPKTELLFSFNGVNQHTKLDAQNHFDLNVKSGSYAFVFYYSSDYYEIYTDSIVGKSQHKTYVSIFFQKAEEQMIMVDKPVIYLYPDIPTIVQVSVKPKGEFTFTYPTYENGWEVTASPNGELKIGDNSYNYLFWESQQKLTFNDFEMTKGSIVSKDETISFLEKKLTEFGMNSKEQTDFITFWGPQLNKNSSNFMHFVMNEDANLFADLTISPKPKAIYRIYLVFCDSKRMSNHSITEQILPKMDRSGFVVLEWGGVEIAQESID
jgi:hypothetical protein